MSFYLFLIRLNESDRLFVHDILPQDEESYLEISAKQKDFTFKSYLI